MRLASADRANAPLKQLALGVPQVRWRGAVEVRSNISTKRFAALNITDEQGRQDKRPASVRGKSDKA